MKPTPGPYEVEQLFDNTLVIVRPWGNHVNPGDTRTFGSYLGAHIAQVKYVTGTGATPTVEQAWANADLLAAAPAMLSLLKEADHFISTLLQAVGADGYLQTSVNAGYLDLLCERIAAATEKFPAWEWQPIEGVDYED
jgi:hypothetical protein